MKSPVIHMDFSLLSVLFVRYFEAVLLGAYSFRLLGPLGKVALLLYNVSLDFW